MGRYLLDTSALIELERKREPASARLRALISGGEEVGTCAVVSAEFCSGLAPELIPRARRLFASMHFWDITIATSLIASRYRYDFARRGIQLATTDALIAAVAYEQGAVIVTVNVRHFPMSDIVVMPIPPGYR